MVSPQETQSGLSLSAETILSVKRVALLVTMPHLISRAASASRSAAMPGKSRVSMQVRSR